MIGLLEAVILMLVVGLSFDFTLHYGASVPDLGCASHRAQLAARKSAVPVSLAAFSSIVAGSCMLFAETHAFYQVCLCPSIFRVPTKSAPSSSYFDNVKRRRSAKFKQI